MTFTTTLFTIINIKSFIILTLCTVINLFDIKSFIILIPCINPKIYFVAPIPCWRWFQLHSCGAAPGGESLNFIPTVLPSVLYCLI